MKKYENVLIQVITVSNQDIVTSSVPVKGDDNEYTMEDFFFEG